jgi:rhamnulokinase
MATMAAVDLGAQSGRVAVGRFDGERLTVQEVHRFPNVPVQVQGVLHWDVLRLYDGILEGLAASAREAGDVDSIGIDTWGVDFALLDRAGQLVQNPVHHRDRRTEGAMEQVFARIPARELYERTGVQLMPINTIFQLFAMATAKDPALEFAQTLLLIPDLFNYWLSGIAACELTNATTSQCLDPRVQAWAIDVLERLESFPTSSARRPSSEPSARTSPSGRTCVARSWSRRRHTTPVRPSLQCRSATPIRPTSAQARGRLSGSSCPCR